MLILLPRLHQEKKSLKCYRINFTTYTNHWIHDSSDEQKCTFSILNTHWNQVGFTGSHIDVARFSCNLQRENCLRYISRLHDIFPA